MMGNSTNFRLQWLCRAFVAETMLCPQFASLWGAVPVHIAPSLTGAPPARRQASMSHPSTESEAGSSSEDDGFECTVCIDDVRTLEGFIWQCREGHVFCAKCYERLGGYGVPCPTCQVPLSNIRSRLAEKQRAKLQKVQTGRAQLRTGSVANPVDEDAARGALLAHSLQRLSAREIEGLQPIGRESPRSLEEIARTPMMMMPRDAQSQEDLSSNLSRETLLKEASNLETLLKEAKNEDVDGDSCLYLAADEETAKYLQHVPLASAGPVEVDPDAAGTKKKKKKRKPKKQSEILLDFAAQLGKPIRSEANDKSPDGLGGGGGSRPLLTHACLSCSVSLPALLPPWKTEGKQGREEAAAAAAHQQPRRR